SNGASVASLLASLRDRRASLPAEIGSFAVLEVVETLRKTRPALVDGTSVVITDDGAVSVSAVATEDEQASVRSVRRLLADLLTASARAPSPELQRLADNQSGHAVQTLSALRDELEASLVPLNRQASRRVLARMIREMDWESAVVPTEEPPTLEELDRELQRILRDDNPDSLPSMDASDASVDELDDLLSGSSNDNGAESDSIGTIGAFQTPAGTDGPPPSFKTVMDAGHDPQLGEPPNSIAPGRLLREPAVEVPVASGQHGMGVWVGVTLGALTLAVVGAAFWLRPDLSQRLDGSQGPTKAAPLRAPVDAEKSRSATVTIRTAAEKAQILRLVGQGPCSIPHVDTGLTHEFVAMAEGFATGRVLVPHNTEWEAVDGALRFETALQLTQIDPSAVGPSLMPRDVGAPSGRYGTLRVVTAPRGAKVYELVGFAPEAKVSGLDPAVTHEFAVLRPGFAPKTATASGADFQDNGGKLEATLTIQLDALK
ncbi:MAG: hypothetical protein RL385_3827, partial [Pseudomonadota bacterium]